MVRGVSKKWWMVVAAGLLVVAGGCGDDGAAVVSVDLFGWHNGSFLDSIADYPDAQELEIRVTRPDEGVEVTQDTFSIADGGAQLPELDGGEGLRMDFELRDNTGEVIAFGATPVFETGKEAAYNEFRTLVSATDEFAPVGARFADGDGVQWYGQSRFDGVSLQGSLGRVGHAAHPTRSGDILVVGGARLSGSYEVGEKPDIEHAFNDIQILESGTGHFTELAGEYGVEDGPVGEDRLQVGRAFHTVTPLGDDRFLVAGGFDADGQAISALELIDLNAEEGNRVQSLNASLSQARGMHTATLRTSDDRVVIAGGLGATSDEVRSTIEVVDVDADSVQSGIGMATSRVGHAAVLLEDGSSVWLIGGRDSGAILDSTELVTADGASATSASSHTMDRRRLGAAAVHLGAAANNRVVIIGGFVSSSGVTASYEIGNPLLIGEIINGSSFGHTWEVDHARGASTAVQLPHSRDLVLLGGQDNNGTPVAQGERFHVDLDEITGPLISIDGEVGSMFERRSGYASSLVSNGRIVIIGGADLSGTELDTAEYFTPYDPVGR